MSLWRQFFSRRAGDSGSHDSAGASASASASVSEETIRSVLNGIMDSRSGKSLVSGGYLQGIHVSDDKVYFTLLADRDSAAYLEPLRLTAIKAIERLPGVRQAIGVLTNADASESRGASMGESPEPTESAAGIGGVKHIIAIASGKGGVGKSTVAANLALSLHALGLRCGLLDADIYGPSQPLLMGVSGKPASDGKIMYPHSAHGISLASIGFMVDTETAMIWRGPMVQSALMQLLTKVVWGELDVLVIDMPPGTGDAQLTLSQQVPLSGAVIVSTPQDIALLDAVRAIKMFEKVNVPILGVIENMSYFVCPHCDEKTSIFACGGAESAAKERNINFLGALPLAVEIREGSDGGVPIVVRDENNPHKETFLSMAAMIAEALRLGVEDLSRPEITFA